MPKQKHAVIPTQVYGGKASERKNHPKGAEDGERESKNRERKRQREKESESEQIRVKCAKMECTCEGAPSFTLSP